MSPSAGEYDYIAGGVFTHPRPGGALQLWLIYLVLYRELQISFTLDYLYEKRILLKALQ